ncbi:hypothetical protein GCM10008955_31450 [Deinococcus malanensis]|uniref:Uncharacterized protein n=1 Tax=Deinococcus malanensis TaxID=1706855 RepID=A0ABQ2EZA0_9DEIO|nr:hypothetical protein GCM10008955_31450 [Deinococcus malanensis]
MTPCPGRATTLTSSPAQMSPGVSTRKYAPGWHSAANRFSQRASRQHKGASVPATKQMARAAAGETIEFLVSGAPALSASPGTREGSSSVRLGWCPSYSLISLAPCLGVCWRGIGESSSEVRGDETRS